VVILTVPRVARRLWQYREGIPEFDRPEATKIKDRLFALIERIEGGGAVARTDAIDRFKQDETLEELISAIEPDVTANKPAAALDRLHTFCGRARHRLRSG
jgi:hypothetical protein